MGIMAGGRTGEGLLSCLITCQFPLILKRLPIPQGRHLITDQHGQDAQKVRTASGA